MAVSLTERQVRDRTEDRHPAGWLADTPHRRSAHLVPEGHGSPARRAALKRLAVVEVTSVRRERLDAITAGDVAAEGFPEMTPAEFVSFFCRSHRGCDPGTEVTRIEWRYCD